VKLILAVIRPNRLDEVRDALREMGVRGMTSVEAQGFGHQGGHTEIYRGAEYQVDFVPEVQVEIVAEDEEAQSIVDAVIASASTGKAGDGMIFILPVEQVYRIRTGRTGPDAI
jgi:nitrogen regulatory protein P-II 1